MDLFSYWRDAPPTSELVAAFLGFKPKAKRVAMPVDANDPSGFGAMIERSGGGTSGGMEAGASFF